MMDVSFLDELRVVPGEESAVLHLIEVAATQIAACIVDPTTQDAGPNSSILRARKTCLEIIRRAADNPYRGNPSIPEQALPTMLVLSLVEHPLLNHLLILLDYTHLRVIERAKRRAVMQQLLSSSSEPAFRPQPSTELLMEAAWSLLTSTTASNPSIHQNNDSIGNLHMLATTAGTEDPMPLSAKANAQSPPTVKFLSVVDDSRQTPSPNVTAGARQETASPLSTLPVAMSPRAGESLAELTPPFSPPRRPTPLLPFSPAQRRPSTPSAASRVTMATSAVATHHSWTLASKRSHQATRLFRMHHAAVCNDPDCTLPSCPSMKHVFRCRSNQCPLPFCFGSKCALIHFQGCAAQTQIQSPHQQKQSSRACPLCRDYWERLACHRIIEQHRQHELLSSGSGHSTGSGGSGSAASASMQPPPPRPPSNPPSPPPRKRPVASYVPSEPSPARRSTRGQDAVLGPAGGDP